jgi:hypothetical protein
MFKTGGVKLHPAIGKLKAGGSTREARVLLKYGSLPA